MLKRGYGFVSEIKKKFLKNKNIKVYNYETTHRLMGFNPTFDYNEEFLIIINSSLEQVKQTYKNFDILIKIKIVVFL